MSAIILMKAHQLLPALLNFRLHLMRIQMHIRKLYVSILLM